MSLGQGFNSRTGLPAGLCIDWLRGGQHSPTGDAGSSTPAATSYTVSLAESSEELRRYLGVEASASFDSGMYHGDASFEYANNLSISKYDVILVVEARKEFIAEAIDGPHLLPDALTLLRSNERGYEGFISRCGDAFVTSITKGASYRGIVRLSTVRQSERTAIRAHLAGGSMTFEAETTFRTALSSVLQSRQLHVNVVSRGGPRQTFDTDVDGLMTAVHNFLERASPENAYPIAATFRPYQIVADPVQLLLNDGERRVGPRSIMRDLANRRARNADFLATIDARLTRGARELQQQACIEYRHRLERISSEVRRAIRLIDDSAAACTHGTSGCDASVGEYDRQLPIAEAACRPAVQCTEATWDELGFLTRCTVRTDGDVTAPDRGVIFQHTVEGFWPGEQLHYRFRTDGLTTRQGQDHNWAEAVIGGDLAPMPSHRSIVVNPHTDDGHGHSITLVAGDLQGDGVADSGRAHVSVDVHYCVPDPPCRLVNIVYEVCSVESGACNR